MRYFPTSFLGRASTGLAIYILLSSLGLAQSIGGEWVNNWKVYGHGTLGIFGQSVAFVGDVNQDGFDDVIVGEPYLGLGGVYDQGRVEVYSGRNGASIWAIDGPGMNADFGISVTGVGDINQDGVPDFFVGAGGIFASLYLYSGATGLEIWCFNIPFSGGFFNLSGIKDVDGDGVPDLLVGDPYSSQNGLIGNGAVLIYSGASKNLIWQVAGQSSGDNLGSSVANGGDLDGDGIADVIVGSDRSSPAGVMHAGSILLYSGASGTLIRQIDGQTEGGLLGTSVAGLSDVDGDGVTDILVGEPQSDVQFPRHAGAAFIFSGGTGNMIRRFDGANTLDFFGRSVAGVGDADGDGLEDVLIGAPGADPNGRLEAGSAFLYTGLTGDLLHRFDGVEAADTFGFSVAGGGEATGDRRPDFLFGATKAYFHWGTPESGAAYLYSLDPFLHLRERELRVSSGDTVQLRLKFPTGEAGMPYAIFASLAGIGPTNLFGLDIPLTPDPLFQSLASGNAPTPFQGVYGHLDGHAQASATLTAGPMLNTAIGSTVRLAAITFEVHPAVGRMSSAVRYLRLVP